MGEAQRRKHLDPGYGQPKPYTLTVYGDRSEEPIAEIPFTITYLASPPARHKRAISNALLIMGYLMRSTENDPQFIRESLGESSEVALAELLPEMPERFWGKLTPPDGANAWLFASADGCVPDGIAEGDRMDFKPYYTDEVFRRAVS